MDTPTIKGIFVRSHLQAVQDKKGSDGLATLAQKFGKPLLFSNLQDVPIKEEEKIIELCLELLEGYPVSESKLHYEAGRLHFRNFTNTPLARILFSVFKS